MDNGDRTPNMLICMKRKMRAWSQSIKKSTGNWMMSGKYLKFEGKEENFIRNGARIMEESITLFHGKANPIRYFSVNELNSLNVERVPYYEDVFYYLHQGCCEGRKVMVRKARTTRPTSMFLSEVVRDIVVATQMANHNNVHKLLGCCLETKCPVLVYEWVQPKKLKDNIILEDGNQSKELLDWIDRLRIAWEVSHAVAYLHTAFPRPIIHRHLTPSHVWLDQESAAKLCDFSLSVTIDEGKDSVNVDSIVGSFGYMAPEYLLSRTVSESSDVYSFGFLLNVLLTGSESSIVIDSIKGNLVSDPCITSKRVTTSEKLQIRAFIQLALFCLSGSPHRRPTMVEVATELHNMIRSPESIPTITAFQGMMDVWPDSLSSCISFEEYGRDEQEIGSSVGALIEQPHGTINSANFISNADQWSEDKKDSDTSEWSDSEDSGNASYEQEIGTPLEALTEQSPSNIYSANWVSVADQQIVDQEQELNKPSIVSRCNPRENVVDSVMLPHDHHVMVTITSIIEVSGQKDEMMTRRIKRQDLGCCLNSEPQEPLVTSDNILERLPRGCKELHDIMASQPPETSIAVGFSIDIFQYHDTQEEFEAYVTTQSVVQLLSMHLLPKSSCLQIFIRYLHNRCKLLEVDSIGFMCPERLAMVKNHLIFTSQYIQYAISKLRFKSYVLAPYYQENHWTLIVVCPQRHVALFFDPMGKNLDDLVIKRRIDMVYRNWEQSKSSRQYLTWKLVQCPRQVHEGECGYYVMRYMNEIVTLYHQTHVNLEECFESDSYTQQQINEIRDIWARYFIDECI